MTPLDFMDFRANLAPASGFQSVQFRLIENKLGVKNELRTNYGKNYYIKVFEDPKVIERVTRSEQEPSLLDLIEKWLEKTPGLEEDGFNFWGKYRAVVEGMNESIRQEAEEEEDEGKKVSWTSWNGFEFCFNCFSFSGNANGRVSSKEGTL